jgi:IS30 family transposase
MLYTHCTTDERNALQAMEGMRLPKSCAAVILGKHPGSVYCELNRNGAHAQSVQRRLDSRPSPARATGKAAP